MSLTALNRGLIMDRSAAMWYYSAAFVLGKRDVIGAWPVCVIIAVVCFGSSRLTAAID